LVSSSGAAALVSDAADVREEPGPSQLVRENGQRRIAVSCNTAGRDAASVARAVEASIAMDVKPPPGYRVLVEGQFRAQERSVRAMLVLGAVAVALMFAVLFTHFGRAGLAVQVMLNIPFAFIGGVLALWIAREPLSTASLVGFISLCGIAARNGVLMLSHYLHLHRNEGEALGPALVIRAGQERVAPVLMTALTTALGMLPLIVDRHAPGREILYPVALVVFGGLITCTVLDFVVTPTVFLRYGRGAAKQTAS
jgi:Cu/Ag efflux pump CusA